MRTMDILEKCALRIPEILLPQKGTNLTAWSVIACDQYTQDEAYWKKAASIVENAYSTLHIILPEVYLNRLSEEQKREKTERIQKTMKDYIAQTIFSPINSLIYTERKTAYNRLRKGIITCIDLEKYDWKPSAKAEIRATEETILERLPPRMEIRKKAALELPHIMLLANDPDNSVIGVVEKYIHQTGKVPLYDFDLMMDAGHISGWQISEECLASVKVPLEKLHKDNTSTDGSTFMFAVGDGNHSLAAAKSVWEAYKKTYSEKTQKDASEELPENIKNHPLRYALVEIVNLYDSGLTFEPIHRVLFNTDVEKLIGFIQPKLGGEVIPCANKAELLNKVESSSASFGFISKTGGLLCLETDIKRLAVSALQPVLDEFASLQNIEMDYIHGSEEPFRLSQEENTVSLLLPPILKDSFFSTISEYGSLPRKSFSMGEASEKRFYLECRKLCV